MIDEVKIVVTTLILDGEKIETCPHALCVQEQHTLSSERLFRYDCPFTRSIEFFIPCKKHIKAYLVGTPDNLNIKEIRSSKDIE